MLKIGVTGGIGSGKSTVCRVFEILGVPVYNADDRARNILSCDEEVRRSLLEAFGENFFTGGKPDRGKLASLVFENSGALDTLNSIVHPAVHNDFTAWLEDHYGGPYIIKEAAILFETGTWRELDWIILVAAPEQMRMERILKRGGITRDEVEKRMENQWPDEKKIPLAGTVIRNDESEPVLPVLLSLHDMLSRGILPAE
ncbi:MAG: dephospho-CoA kinase [Marinilabiliales bacterium]|nr:MAG: dephospho-CoA kinase [Marinilabiliales bacterium]